MIAALILFALGVADWLTTRAILAHGGYERIPLARWGMARVGVTRFMLGKALVMGGLGYACSLVPGAVYVWPPLAALYAGVIGNTLLVLRRRLGRR